MGFSAEDFEIQAVNVLQMNLQAALDQTAASYLEADRAHGLADPDGTSWVELLAPVRTDGPPSGFGDYYPGGNDIIAAWPSIEVAIPDESYVDFDVAGFDADATFTLVVQIWLKDGRFPVLNRMMKRYGRTALDVLNRRDLLPGFEIQEARLAYRTNPESRDESDRIQSGVLLFLTLGSSLIR